MISLEGEELALLLGCYWAHWRGWWGLESHSADLASSDLETAVRNREQTGLRVDGRTRRGLSTAATHSVTGLCVTKPQCPKVPPVWTQLFKVESCVKSFLFCLFYLFGRGCA